MRTTTRRWMLLVIAGLLVAVAGGVALYQRELSRLTFATSLFTGAEQYENFARIADLFPTRSMQAPPNAVSFAAGAPMDLPG